MLEDNDADSFWHSNRHKGFPGWKKAAIEGTYSRIGHVIWPRAKNLADQLLLPLLLLLGGGWLWFLEIEQFAAVISYRCATLQFALVTKLNRLESSFASPFLAPGRIAYPSRCFHHPNF